METYKLKGTKRQCKACDGKTLQFAIHDDSDQPVWFCDCCYGTTPRKVRPAKLDPAVEALWQELTGEVEA